MHRQFRWIAAVVLIGVVGTVGRAADIYVSPTGSDTAAGTSAQPLQSLLRARDAACNARHNAPNEPVTVWLGGGKYVLPNTFELSAADSGTTQAPTIYRAIDGQSPRLIGGRLLAAKDFHPITNPQTLARIPAALQGKIVEVDLDALNVQHVKRFADSFADNGNLLELFVNGNRMPLSRFPNDGYMAMKRVLDNAGGPATKSTNDSPDWAVTKTKGQGGTFEYREAFYADHERWAKQLDRGVWFKGYWRVTWQNEAIRVGSIDTQKHTVTFAKPIAGGIGNKYTRPAGNGQEKYWVLNLLEEVDVPGEWAIDFKDHKLYFYPPTDLSTAEVMISDSDAPVITLANASRITLRGLTLEGSLRDGVHIKGGDNNLIAGCTVRNVTRMGIVVERGTNHTVQSCDVYGIGWGGIWVTGGDDSVTPRVASGHRVVNNHIHHFNQIQTIYGGGINIGYTDGGKNHTPAVGVYVAHNLVHDTPHAGMLFSSWDSIFEYNEVFRYATISNDIGAFYSYDYFNNMGNITFRYNLMHDSDEGDGIYFDTDQRDMHVYGNIAYLKSAGSRGWGFLYKIGTQAKNPTNIECYNNLAIACRRGFNFFTAMPKESRIENNVAINCDTPWEYNTVTGGKGASVKGGFATGPMKTYDADPGFVDIAHLDFRLKPNAQLRKDLPNFKPIPVAKIGLYVDEYRKSLPTNDQIDRFNLRTKKANLGYEILDRK